MQKRILKCLNLHRYAIILLSRSKCPWRGLAQNDDVDMTAVLMSNRPKVTAYCIDPINDW